MATPSGDPAAPLLGPDSHEGSDAEIDVQVEGEREAAEAVARRAASENFMNSEEGKAALKDELDTTLGLGYWTRAVGIVVWSNVSLPLNIALTVLTALTAADSVAKGLFPENYLTWFTVAATILSAINTIFKPNDEAKAYDDTLKSWCVFGTRFEDIFYKNLSGQESNNTTIKAYLQLLHDVNEFKAPQDKKPLEFAVYLWIKLWRMKCSWLRQSNSMVDQVERAAAQCRDRRHQDCGALAC